MKSTFILLNGSKPFVFTVPPLDLKIDSSQKTVSVNLIDFGEMVKIGEKSCDRISFSTFIPGMKSPFYRPYMNPLPSNFGVEALKKWAFRKDKLKLIIPQYNISYKCYIEKIDTEIKERTGDVHVGITLVEDRDPKNLDDNLGLFLRW